MNLSTFVFVVKSQAVHQEATRKYITDLSTNRRGVVVQLNVTQVFKCLMKLWSWNTCRPWSFVVWNHVQHYKKSTQSHDASLIQDNTCKYFFWALTLHKYNPTARYQMRSFGTIRKDEFAFTSQKHETQAGFLTFTPVFFQNRNSPQWDNYNTSHTSKIFSSQVFSFPRRYHQEIFSHLSPHESCDSKQFWSNTYLHPWITSSFLNLSCFWVSKRATESLKITNPQITFAIIILWCFLQLFLSKYASAVQGLCCNVTMLVGAVLIVKHQIKHWSLSTLNWTGKSTRK